MIELFLIFLNLFFISDSFEIESSKEINLNDWSMGISEFNDKLFVVKGLEKEILIFDNNFFIIEKIKINESKCDGHIHGIDVNKDSIFLVMNNNNCILEINKDGLTKNFFGSSGNDNGLLTSPQNVEIFDDKIFVSDSDNDRIQVFDMKGNFLYKFGSSGSYDGEFNSPMGILIKNSEIFVADAQNNRIQVFDMKGNFLYKFEENFHTPHNIEKFHNYIVVLDTYNKKIKIFEKPINFSIKNENILLNFIFIMLFVSSLVLFFILKKKNIFKS